MALLGLPPESYTTTKTWNLTAGDGEKRVYVRFQDNAGNWSQAYSDSIILDTISPNKPQWLSGTAGHRKVDLSWRANAEMDLAGYNIYRSMDATTYIKLNTALITLTSYEDSGLTNDITYYYKLTPVDKAGNESIYSEIINATPRCPINLESEPNNDFSSANTIPLGSPFNGAIETLNDEDYFKITIPQVGKLFIRLTDVAANIDAHLYLYDSNYVKIADKYSGGNGKSVDLEKELSSAGDYYLRIVDKDNNSSSTSLYTLATDFATFWIDNLFDSPDAFSPNGDWNYDTSAINYLIPKDGKVTLKLYDSNNNLVRTLLNNTPQTSGTNTVVWDGKDDSGNILPNGTYTYKLDAVDNQGNSAAQKQGTSTIDNPS